MIGSFGAREVTTRARGTILSFGLVVVALLGATPNPSPTPLPDATASPSAATPAAVTADEILARMVAARKGLNSFSVPVHFDVKLRRPLPVAVGMAVWGKGSD